MYKKRLIFQLSLGLHSYFRFIPTPVPSLFKNMRCTRLVQIQIWSESMQNHNRRMVIISQYIYGVSYTSLCLDVGKTLLLLSSSPPPPLRNIRYTAGCNSVGAWRWFSVHIQEYLRTFLIMVQNHMVPCAYRRDYERQRECKKGPSHKLNIFCRLRQLIQ